MLCKSICLQTLSLVLVLAALLIGLAAPARCARGASQASHAFVKVNSIYFLYTYPVVPYLDAHGVLMVGLKGFGRIIDHNAAPHQEPQPGVECYATVMVNAVARMEVLTFNGYRLTFRAGSSTLDTDGKQRRMAAAAVWDRQAGQMVVPLAPLAHALGLRTHWDPARRVLSVTGPPDLTEELDRGDEGGDVQDEINDTWNMGNTPLDTHALVPISTKMRPELATVADPVEHLALTFQNVSGATLGQDEWLNLTLLFANDGQSPGIDSDYAARGQGRGSVPPIPPFGTRTMTVGLAGPQVVHPFGQIHFTDYVLCVVADPVSLAPAQAVGSTSAEPSLGS